MTPDKRAKMVLAAAYMGAVATTLLALSRFFGWPDSVRGFSVGLLLVSLIVLLLRSLRDEYLEELWAAGASLAFIAVIAWTILLPFVEGLFDGINGEPDHMGMPLSWTDVVCLAAFFAGFLIKQIRGRA